MERRVAVVQTLLTAGLAAFVALAPAHAVDPPELFQHLDKFKIESELSSTAIVTEQDDKVAIGKIHRWEFVYLDPEPLKAIATAPNRRGWVNFNVFPGEEFNLELHYSTVLNSGRWRTAPGESETPVVVVGPKVNALGSGESSRGYLIRLTGGQLGNYTVFAVEGEPNLHVVEQPNGAYWPGEGYSDDFVIPDESEPGNGHGIEYPGYVEGGSTDIDVAALWMPSFGNSESSRLQVESLAIADTTNLNEALSASGIGTIVNVVYVAPAPPFRSSTLFPEEPQRGGESRRYGPRAVVGCAPLSVFERCLARIGRMTGCLQLARVGLGPAPIVLSRPLSKRGVSCLGLWGKRLGRS